MLLTVDIGNTSIHNGIFKGKVLKKTFRVSTYSKSLTNEYSRLLKPYLEKIEGVIVVSVVPSKTKIAEKILKNLTKKKILIVGRNIHSGIKNKYKSPKQVGQDRLINAKSAVELYGAPSIIVDFGTAITIDVINKKKEYLGGLIVPGVEISLKALSEKAALLPKITLKKPNDILGRETHESMIKGTVYGFASLCDGATERLRKKYSKNAKLIATGGLSTLIMPYCSNKYIIDKNLTLKGSAFVYWANQGR